MKDKRECKIIQDLLPNYLEDLLSTETKEYAEKHLQECDECSEILNNMNDTIKEYNDNIKQKEVNYLKKFKNKMNVLKTILIIVLVVILLIFGRRIIIVTNLANKAEDIQRNGVNNYYARVEGYYNGEYRKSECFYKNGNYVIKMIEYAEEEKSLKTSFYKNESDQFMLIESEEGKIINKNTFLPELTPLPRYDGINPLLMALVYGVETVKLGNTECYVLKNKGIEQYIDKNTGLLVKEINRSKNTVTDYQYEFGIVEDSDISIPDLSEYEQTKEKEKEEINEVTYSLEYNSADYKDLPRIESEVGYAYDTGSPEKAIGVADYVFIAKINGILRTEYRFNTKEPYTVYSATVIENIKGEIIKDKNIEIFIHGGLNSDKKSYTIFGGIEFLNVGEYYILLPYTASDGRLGISNTTSIVELGKSIGSSNSTVERYKEAAKSPIAPEGKKYVKSKLYDVEELRQAGS